LSADIRNLDHQTRQALRSVTVLEPDQVRRLEAYWDDNDWAHQPWFRSLGEHSKAVIDALRTESHTG
jgi:hypothetical protein